ncbi:MAG: OadG family protein [Desulfovibrionaceae bacterium]
MIEQGFILMVSGMGVVFLFLTLMVLVMHITAAFFKKYAHLFPEVQPAKAAMARPAAVAGAPHSDDTVDIAVAIAAVKDFMQR